jgi:GNAT superfamily N-acetyltransferase
VTGAIELAPGDYGRVRGLLPAPDEAGHMTFVHAVVDGAMEGVVVVDDEETPTAAFVCNACDFWLALGEPHRGFAERATALISHHPRLPRPGYLWCSAPGWKQAIDGLLPVAGERNEYGHRPRGIGPFLHKTDGVEVVPIDATLAATFQDRGVDPWVVNVFGGPENFAKRSFGFAVLAAGELAAFCAACAIGAGEAEIEIGSATAYRRKGLATLAFAAFVRGCDERGLAPAWTCASDNRPSVRMAESLGFPFRRRVAGFGVG